MRYSTLSELDRYALLRRCVEEVSFQQTGTRRAHYLIEQTLRRESEVVLQVAEQFFMELRLTTTKGVGND
jgi:hypothetical protein